MCLWTVSVVFAKSIRRISEICPLDHTPHLVMQPPPPENPGQSHPEELQPVLSPSVCDRSVHAQCAGPSSDRSGGAERGSEQGRGCTVTSITGTREGARRRERWLEPPERGVTCSTAPQTDTQTDRQADRQAATVVTMSGIR